MLYLKPQASFSLNFTSLFITWETTVLCFVSWNFIWVGQKEPIKVKIFLNVHVKFHQICTLTGLFCWKYIKLQLKMYREFMSHDTEEWCKIWRKTGLWFGKWHEEFSKLLPKDLKVSKLGLWWGPYIQGRKCIS